MAETLHSIIEKVLFENGGKLKVEEIVKIINEKNLYKRHDNKPVPKAQILARVKKYSGKFSMAGELISVKNTNDLNYQWENFRLFLNEEIFLNKNITDNRISRFKIYEDILKGNEIPNRNYLKLIDKFGNNDKKEDFSISLLEKISDHLLGSEDFNHLTLPAEYSDILANLKIFSEFNEIQIESNLIWSFLFAFKRINLFSKYKVSESYSETKRHNNRIPKLNNLIANKIQEEIPQDDWGFSENIKFHIYTHPIETSNKYPGEFSFVNDESFDRMIVILPESSLQSSKKTYQEAKEYMLNKSGLKSIITLPQYNTSSPKLSLIFFDNLITNNSDDIYFADFSSQLDLSPEDVARHINHSKVIKNVSIKIPLKKVRNKNNLHPKLFVQDPYDFEKKSNHEIYNISDLIRSHKRGNAIKDRKGLYSGGEIKFLRQTDLDINNFVFHESDKLVGVDYDEVKENRYKTFIQGIVISTIGNNPKINILPGDKEFLLDPNLILIEVDETIISPLYFITEFRKEYVQRQVEFFLKGSTIKRLLLKDFLKIKMQIPKRKEQDAILVNRLETDHFFPELKEKEDFSKENFVKILKHTLKQRIGSISSDFSTLSKYLTQKHKSENSINMDEVIVPIFEGDSLEIKEDYKLETILNRIQNALAMSHNILDKAEDILKVESIHKSEFNINNLLSKIGASYTKITVNVEGPIIYIVADSSLIQVMVNNIIDNAIKHGELTKKDFNGKVLIRVKKENKNLILQIQNNGSPISESFKVEDFLSNGKTQGEYGGTGFGGFLISNILKKHNGKIEIMDMKSISEYNVGFRIIIPLE